MFKRRDFLRLANAGAFSLAATAVRAESITLASAELRGSIDAVKNGLLPGASDDQSKTLNQLIRMAAKANAELFLPPGNYQVSNLDLPDNTRITGVPGASRLVYGGDGHLLMADDAKRITLSGLVLDGANRWLADYSKSIVHLANVDLLDIDNCEITGSGKFGLWLENCAGRVTGNQISGASDAGIYAVQSRGMAISGNVVSTCGDGGILVHRWTKGADGTLVQGNRVTDIQAKSGGTGEFGNGINVFQADNVMVSNNHVARCAFSAIRSNGGSGVQIIGNQCLQSGETAIYSEFVFEGAIVSDNLVDGAANGISIVNFNEGGRLATVSGNIVRNLSLTGPYIHDGIGFGIGISAEAETVVSGNVIENAPKWGLALGWGPFLRNVIVTGNVVRKADIGCVVTVVEESGNCIISGNTFDDVKTGAIMGFRWADKASDELADGQGQSFPHLSISGNLHS